MKKFFVLLVLSSMFPLCAMEREVPGDREILLQTLREQLAILKAANSIEPADAALYDDILNDETLTQANLDEMVEIFEGHRSGKGLLGLAPAPADLPAVIETGAGGVTVVEVERGGAGSQGGGSILKKPLEKVRTSKGTQVYFKGLPEDPPERETAGPVPLLAAQDGDSGGEEGEDLYDLVYELDEDGEGEFDDSAASDEGSGDDEEGSADFSGPDEDSESSGTETGFFGWSQDEGGSPAPAPSAVVRTDDSEDDDSAVLNDPEVARVEALYDRLDQLEEEAVDVNYLHAALDDEEIPLDVVELMIVACEKKFEEGSREGAQSDDDVMYTEKRLQCKVNRGAQSDGEEPKGEPMDLALAAPSRAARADEPPEWLAEVQGRLSELMVLQLVDVSELLEEALLIKVGGEDSQEKIQDLFRHIAAVEDQQEAALARGGSGSEVEAAEVRDSEMAALDKALPFSPLAEDAADERDEVHSDGSDGEASSFAKATADRLADRDEDDLSSAEEVDIIGGPPTPASSPVQDDDAPSDEDADEGDALQVVDPAREESAFAEATADGEEGGDEPEVEAPAAAVSATYEEAGGVIGDLDAADKHEAEADRARIKKKTELAAKLGSLQKCGVDVADLWNSLGCEETDLANLEKEIDALEAGPERGASLSLGGKAGIAPADVSRGWLKKAVQPPVLGKVAGVTFGAFIIGGLTHRHVEKQRALGKPTIFDRMRQWRQQWKEKAERLVRRS